MVRKGISDFILVQRRQELLEKEKEKFLSEVNRLNEIEQIELEIKRINGNIINCEYDLNTHFKDNHRIKHKLNLLQERKEILQKQLQNDKNTKE